MPPATDSGALRLYSSSVANQIGSATLTVALNLTVRRIHTTANVSGVEILIVLIQLNASYCTLTRDVSPNRI